MLALLSALAAASDAPPPPDLLDEARRRSTRGAALLATGAATMGGGLAVLLVREGAPGDAISEADGPSLLVSDLRSAGGALLLMGGFAVLYAGGNDLGVAAGQRRLARSVTLAPALPLHGPAVLVVSGRF